MLASSSDKRENPSGNACLETRSGSEQAASSVIANNNDGRV
jgi:hypothetical protein